MNKEDLKDLKLEGEETSPGIARDGADGEKVTAKMVREDVKELNNNPRNDYDGN